MARVFRTTNGDECDSDFERAVVQQLIDRGIDYEYESIEHARLFYKSKIKDGSCLDCDSTNVGQQRYRTLDILSLIHI